MIRGKNKDFLNFEKEKWGKQAIGISLADCFLRLGMRFGVRIWNGICWNADRATIKKGGRK